MTLSFTHHLPTGYILGEFGHLLNVPCSDYFSLLQQRFPAVGLQTKALLLSAYAKARPSLRVTSMSMPFRLSYAPFTPRSS